VEERQKRGKFPANIVCVVIAMRKFYALSRERITLLLALARNCKRVN
jgi:hypothetical protein